MANFIFHNSREKFGALTRLHFANERLITLVSNYFTWQGRSPAVAFPNGATLEVNHNETNLYLYPSMVHGSPNLGLSRYR